MLTGLGLWLQLLSLEHSTRLTLKQTFWGFLCFTRLPTAAPDCSLRPLRQRRAPGSWQAGRPAASLPGARTLSSALLAPPRLCTQHSAPRDHFPGRALVTGPALQGTLGLPAPERAALWAPLWTRLPGRKAGDLLCGWGRSESRFTRKVGLVGRRAAAMGTMRTLWPPHVPHGSSPLHR